MPLGLALLLLSGVCPLIAWRKGSIRNFQRNFLNPLVVSLLGVAVLYGSGIRHAVALISLSICVFTFSTIVLEFYRGTRARRASTGGTTLQALRSLMTRNRRRYGGYIIHFGVVLIFLGITGSSAYKIERDIVLDPTEQTTVGDFTLRYETLESEVRPTHESLRAKLEVSRGGRHLTTLYPERRFYFRPESADHGSRAAHVAARRPVRHPGRFRAVGDRHLQGIRQPVGDMAVDWVAW